MNTLFYITSGTEINFTAILAKEFHANSKDSNLYGFTHTTIIKDNLKRTTNIFKNIVSESDFHPHIDNKKLAEHELMFINYIEQKTQSNLWKFIYQDRWLSMRRNGFLYKEGTNFKRNELIRIIITKFSAIENFLKSNKIEKLIFVTQDVGTSSASILYEIAKYLKIKVICPTISKFGNYFFLNDTIYSNVSQLEENYHKSSQESIDDKASNKIHKIYNQIIKEQKAAYSVPTSDQKKYFKSFFNFLTSFINYYANGYFKDPKLKSPFLYYIDKIRTIILKQITIRFFHFDDLNETEKFVFFPLHLEPELVLLLHASYYSDQISIIKNIAKSLPGDTVLVLKDHPVALGRRNYSFYKRLKTIPNVKILNPNFKSSVIIKNCLAVATITGTAGIEAFYFKKPTITFGNVFYNFLPSIVNIKNMEILPSIWPKINSSSPADNEILKYLTAIYLSGYDIDLLGIIKKTSFLKTKEVTEFHSEEIIRYAIHLINL